MFGAKTSSNQILAIFRVARERCREEGRKQFDFWRAKYSAVEGKMALVPQSMLKVEERLALRAIANGVREHSCLDAGSLDHWSVHVQEPNQACQGTMNS